jgi:hypothetical protein
LDYGQRDYANFDVSGVRNGPDTPPSAIYDFDRTTGVRMAKLTDDVWQVMKDYLMEHRGIDAPKELRDLIEDRMEITPFDGGAFIASGNEFDLFVTPSRRGRWNIRGEVTRYLRSMAEAHGTIVVKIYDDNIKSLRLAKFFGFTEISRENGMIRLENSHG